MNTADKRPVPRNPLDDSIKIVETQNHHLPYECTNKGLGGSTATWGGRCVMYDEIDFMPRKILDGQCTWDIALFHESADPQDGPRIISNAATPDST